MERGKKILIVEDSAIIALSESRFLESKGFTVARVLTGEAAIEIFRAGGSDIDLILMDVDLGEGMDGAEAAREILKTADVPIIFISSHTEQDIVESTKAIAGYGYVLKEAGEFVLLASVEMAFRLHEAQQELKRREQVLRESEERFRMIALHSPDVIFYQDLDLNYTWVANPSSHLEASRRLGKTDRDFFSPEEAEYLINLKRSVIATGVSARTEVHLLSEDGSQRPYEGFFEPRRDTSGTIIGLTGYARDISERRRMEEALRESDTKLRLLAGNINDVIFALDLGLHITYVSPSVERVLGYTAEECLHKSPQDFFIDPSRKQVDRLRETLLSAWRAGVENPTTTETFQMAHRNGTRLYGELRVSLRCDDRKQPAEYVGVGRDVTERMQTEHLLHESEERFRLMADTAPVFIWLAGVDRKATYFNKRWLEFTGRSLAQQTGDGWLQSVHPEDRPRCIAAYIRHDLPGAPFTVEYRLRRFDGQYRWMLDNGTPRFFPDGTVAGYVGSCIDITDRHDMEERLRKSEQRYRVLAENGYDLICELDAQGTYRFTNSSFSSTLGFDRDELLGTSAFALIHPDDRPAVQEEFTQAFGTTTAHTKRFRSQNKRGEYRWFEAVGRVYTGEGGAERLVVIARDVTVTVMAHEQVAASERTYRGVTNTIDDAIYIHDLEGRFLDVNDGAVAMYGHSREEFLGRTPDFLSAPGRNDPAATQDALRRAAAGEPQHFEWWGIRRNGEVFPKDVRLTKGWYFGREAIIAIARDITERKLVEAKLADSERRYRMVVENVNEALIQTDMEGVITFVNRRFSDLTGFETEEVLGQTGRGLFLDETAWNIVRGKVGLWREGKSDVYDLRMRRKTGGEIRVEVSGSPAYSAAGEIVGSIGVLSDVTEQRTAQDALLVSEQKYRDMYEEAPIGIYRSTVGGQLLSANAAATRMFGYEADADVLPTVTNIARDLFVDPAVRDSLVREALETEGFVRREVLYRRRDGSAFSANVHMRAMGKGRGAGTILEGYVEDITERKQMELSIRDREEQLRLITDNMMDMVAQMDHAMIFRYVSSSHARVLGYRREELMDTWAPDLLHPDDRQETTESLRSMLRRGEGSIRLRCRHKNGHYIWLEITGRSIQNAAGEYTGAVIASRDISEQRQAEEELRNTLKEKEILVREVLHRVKNNLNLVASLLYMQSVYAEPKEAGVFLEARNRVIAMSRIHEKLYASASLALLKSKGYVEDVVSGLLQAYGRPTIRVVMDVESFEIGLDKAIPLGLIINELVTNSFKYAFPDNRAGEIAVGFRRGDRGEAVLQVRDTGVGLSEAVDTAKPRSLGLSIVSMLTEQIGGRLVVNRVGGTDFTLAFPV